MPRNERGERSTMIDTGYTGRKATELWRDALTSAVNYSVLRSVIGFPRAEELKVHTEGIPLRKLLFFFFQTTIMSFVFKLLVTQTTFFVYSLFLRYIYRMKNISRSLISEKKEDFDVPRINFATAISSQIERCGKGANNLQNFLVKSFLFVNIIYSLKWNRWVITDK